MSPCLLAAAFASASACAAPAERPGPAEDQARCDVAVRFGSYAMGIDRGAAAEVERIVAAHATVTGVRRSAAGREGEYELCVATRSAQGAENLFERLKAALPANPRGPVSIRFGERRFSVPRQ